MLCQKPMSRLTAKNSAKHRNVEVPVDQAVSHPCRGLPRHLWPGVGQVGRKVLHRLADHEKVVQDRIMHGPIAGERIVRHPVREFDDRVDCVRNIVEKEEAPVQT